MTKRYTRSSATTAEHMADRLDNRDEDVMQGLVTAGALVALADGRVEEVERDELLNFIDRQQLAPTTKNRHRRSIRPTRATTRGSRQRGGDHREPPSAGWLVTGIRCASHGATGRRGGSANPSRRIASARADTPDHDEPVCQGVASEASHW